MIHGTCIYGEADHRSSDNAMKFTAQQIQGGLSAQPEESRSLRQAASRHTQKFISDHQLNSSLQASGVPQVCPQKHFPKMEKDSLDLWSSSTHTRIRL